LTAPWIGLRFHKQNVKNNAGDQEKVIKLFASISTTEGARRSPQHLVDAIWDFRVF